MTPSNITNRFRKCGVYPLDPEAVKPDEESSDEDPEEDGENNGEEQGETMFTAEEEIVFKQQFEGFDIFDERYSAWLKVNHPQSTCDSYPHLYLEEDKMEDLEYMLSLADDLVAFCGETNTSDPLANDSSSFDGNFDKTDGIFPSSTTAMGLPSSLFSTGDMSTSATSFASTNSDCSSRTHRS